LFLFSFIQFLISQISCHALEEKMHYLELTVLHVNSSFSVLPFLC
jgi:hypothetical protein